MNNDMENSVYKKCGYRNCDKDISNMRGNAIFCCRNHKTYEGIYKKRQKKNKGEYKF